MHSGLGMGGLTQWAIHTPMLTCNEDCALRVATGNCNTKVLGVSF